MNPALAIRTVVEGFHRHDSVDRALSPDGPPRVGDAVKIQLTLAIPLACAEYPDETTTWLAMGGTIVEVVDPDRVVAQVVASTERAPADFGGGWRAELVRARGLEFPWCVSRLAPSPPIERTIGARHEGNHYFRIACEGDQARAAFDDVLRAMNAEPAEHSTFLSLVLGSYVAWLFIVPPELDDVAPAYELLVDAADAVIVFGTSSRARPAGVVVVESEAGAPAIDACKAAMRAVLEQVRAKV